VIPIVRLFNPKGPDRVAVVSVQEAWAHAGSYNIQVARGAKRTKLSAGTTYGPFAQAEIAERHAEVVAKLKSEGFVRAGFTAMLQALVSQKAAARAHAATRLGWSGDTTAVPALLLAADNAGTELTSVIDALGRLGDKRAVTVCRAEAGRKLLSRRRSGAEALRNLGDTEGLKAVREAALERLPEALRNALTAQDESRTDTDAISAVTSTFAKVEERDRGLCLDTLYEIATPLAVAVTKQGLATMQIEVAYMWRYTRSILRRAMLRDDFAMFGWLAHRIEILARKSYGMTATIKSGLDGVSRQTPVFRKPTQEYNRRLTWRYLTQLARHTPSKYPYAAAEAVIAYQPEDRLAPKGAYDEWSSAYLYNRVVRGDSIRWEFMPRTMKFRLRALKKNQSPPPDAREESYRELWDAQPRAFLRVLAASKIVETHAFAERGVKAHPDVMKHATPAELLAMLGAPYEPTVSLSLGELERRFDPTQIDWALVHALVNDTRDVVKPIAIKFVTLTAHEWTSDIERVLTFLASPDAALRTTVANLVVASLDEADTWFRRELAERILAVLQTPEATPGAHEGHARVARDGLAEELGNLLGLDEIMQLVSAASPAAQAVGGTLLGRRPDAVGVLGVEKILAMAIHDVASVRTAAQELIRGAFDTIKSDPSLVFTLAESDWKDTRDFAFEMLRTRVDFTALGLDGVVGLCDSNRVEVQDFGRELVLRDIDKLDMAELIHRLTQHPHPNMRRFALDLVTGHLKEGFVALAKLEGFFRMALFDLWPSRNEKRAVMDFLLQRGMKDERQAEVAARVLGEFVRTKGKADFERALEGLVRIKLAYPEIESRATPRMASAATQGGAA
jgi:hypothetical protein